MYKISYTSYTFLYILYISKSLCFCTYRKRGQKHRVLKTKYCIHKANIAFVSGANKYSGSSAFLYILYFARSAKALCPLQRFRVKSVNEVLRKKNRAHNSTTPQNCSAQESKLCARCDYFGFIAISQSSQSNDFASEARKWLSYWSKALLEALTQHSLVK